jgi:CRISPR type IV-associated protein Csf1
MNYNCYFCGCVCTNKYSTKDFVRSTFTNVDIVADSLSKYVCEECAYFFGSKSKIEMIDKEVRTGSPRLYSWVITKDKRIAFSKKHVKEIREKILIPPEPPFKIIISESGKKNIAFRSIWAQTKDDYPIQFEEKRIYVNISKLISRLKLADYLTAAIGKPALLVKPHFNYFIAVNDYYNTISEYEKWLTIQNELLSQLAAWLAKNKEESRNESKK